MIPCIHTANRFSSMNRRTSSWVFTSKPLRCRKGMISVVLVDGREDAVVGLGMVPELARLLDAVGREAAGAQARPLVEPPLPEPLDLARRVLRWRCWVMVAR